VLRPYDGNERKGRDPSINSRSSLSLRAHPSESKTGQVRPYDGNEKNRVETVSNPYESIKSYNYLLSELSIVNSVSWLDF
jgi:hypothetical protein